MVQRKFATSRRFEYLDAMKFKKLLRQFVSARGFLVKLNEADLHEKMAAVDTDLFSAWYSPAPDMINTNFYFSLSQFH